MNKKKILLAFSGGLDTSAIIPWLKENYDSDVIAYCADLGNAPREEELKQHALRLGASDFIFEDLKDTFVSQFVFCSIRASATYQDDYLLGTALGRPLIAERMAYYAKKMQISALAHGCTGKGNDQLRFERTWAYLMPQAEVIAPWRIWNFTGRDDLYFYLKKKGFELTQKEKSFSEDVNLLHRSCEGGILENPSQEFEPKQIYKWVLPLSEIDEQNDIEILFETGFPVSINQEKKSPSFLLDTLNQIGGRAGIGVQDLVEERINGIKSRGVYETPGGTLLHTAIKALKHLCWGRALLTTGRSLGQSYGECIYDGFWHTPLRDALESFFESASKTLTGIITLRCEKGQIRVLSRKSSYSLYHSESVTFDTDQLGIHSWAEGYCQTATLQQRQLGRRVQQNEPTLEK